MNANGTLSPWRSPAGKPLSIAAAAPVIPWSDLAYSLEPNGRTLDYRLTGANTDLVPVRGREAVVRGGSVLARAGAGLLLHAGLRPAGRPDDVVRHRRRRRAVRRTRGDLLANQIAQYHSPYYLLDGKYGTGFEAPSPLLIANGFTDDLFPVDEALRYYNLERALYPSDPSAARSTATSATCARTTSRRRGAAVGADRTLLCVLPQPQDTGRPPASGVTAKIETCPKTAPSGPTVLGLDLGRAAPRRSRLTLRGPAQTVTSGAGNPSISEQIDPVAGPGACATVSADRPGRRRRHLPPAGRRRWRLHACSGPRP